MTAIPQGRAIGYTRLERNGAHANGNGVTASAQARAIRLECARRGWTLVAIFSDVVTFAGAARRQPEIGKALAVLDRGEADVLVAHARSQLCRSTLDHAHLAERARQGGWRVHLLHGALAADDTAAEMRRESETDRVAEASRRVSERTKAAMALRKAEGARFGRPSVLSRDVLERVVQLRDSGLSWRRVADALNEAGIPTAHGGEEWRVSTVRSVYQRREGGRR